MGLSTWRRRVRRYAVAPLVMASLMAFGLSAPLRADTGDAKNKADEQVADLRDQLEGTSTELVTAYLALQEAQAKLPAAQAALTQAQAAATAAEKHNTEVGIALAVAQADEARATERLAANATQLDATQRALDAFAADMFQGGGESQLSMALGATNPDDFATRLVLADTVTSMT
ncbi:MAG TPA: M23 family peptidase, partial [Dermatophilaceae bacterium]|nr:M23 family peptidase [Dermatophilaceae bacterium]